jgi:hypothetical protein
MPTNTICPTSRLATDAVIDAAETSTNQTVDIALKWLERN